MCIDALLIAVNRVIRFNVACQRIIFIPQEGLLEDYLVLALNFSRRGDVHIQKKVAEDNCLIVFHHYVT